MKNIIRHAIAAAVVVLAASAQAQIIDIGSAHDTGTTVSLAAGDYALTFTDAGAFAAWNPWGRNVVSGCNAEGSACAQGWTDAYAVIAGAQRLAFAGTGGFFSTESAALAAGLASAPDLLHLDSATDVKFYIADSYYGDNVGGVSVALSAVGAVPEPSTYALLLAGLAGIGFVARRRA